MAAILAVPAFSQATTDGQAQNTPAATATAPDNTASATGNPLARKKWVNRQINPVKDRLNELDQLSAKNASDIKDFDARAQAGIHQAQTTADQANSQAQMASNQANQAQTLAIQASSRTTQLSSTVSNLDQYQPITDTEIHFRPGQVALNAKAKDALDQIATQLQGQKGYIVEVQGYSHARGQVGISTSQKLSDAVVRYLVVDHQIPVYRIHLIALGNVPVSDSGTDTTLIRGSLVHITLMHNSLAAMSAPSGSSPIGATQSSSSQPNAQ
jgi:outer membrane protein OmpA-like peptidoglycan-associated protein